MIVAGFFVAMFVQTIDPVLMLGPVVAGFVARAWWKAILVGAAWALLVKIAFRALTSSQPQSSNAGLILLAGIGAGAVVAGVVWLIRDQVKKAKERQ